jgi:hypothetical protein
VIERFRSGFSPSSKHFVGGVQRVSRPDRSLLSALVVTKSLEPVAVDLGCGSHTLKRVFIYVPLKVLPRRD